MVRGHSGEAGGLEAFLHKDRTLQPSLIVRFSPLPWKQEQLLDYRAGVAVFHRQRNLLVCPVHVICQLITLLLPLVSHQTVPDNVY